MAWGDGEIDPNDLGPSTKNADPISPTRAVARNEYKSGIANMLGGIGDAPARAFELGKAAFGAGTVFPQVLSDITGKPKSTFIPEPNIGRANMFTDYFRNLLEVDENIKPVTKTQKLIGAAAGGAGASAIPLVPANNVQQLISNYISQSLIGAAAGVGAETAGAMTRDNPFAKIVGGLITGMVVPSASQRRGEQIASARDALMGGKDLLKSQRAQTIAENVARRNTQTAVSGIPGAADRLEQGLDMQSRIPGFRPSVAEMLQEPQSGVAGIQRQFTQLRPENINRDIARRETSLSALDDYLASMLPKGSNAQVRGEVNRALAEQSGDLARQQGTVAGALPNVRQTEIGEVLQTAARAEKSAMQPAIREAYDAAFEAAGNARVALDNVVGKVEDILGRKITQFQPDTAPFTVRKLMDLVSPEQASWNPISGAERTAKQVKKVTLKELDEIRSAINADIRSAAASSDPTAAMRLRNLGQIHGAIDDAVRGSQLPANAKEQYFEAVRKYREEFAPRFKEGLNQLMFRSTRLNEDAIRPDDIISKYFRPGGETEATQLTRLLGNNQQGKEAATTGILDLYRNRVVNPTTGEIDLAAHSRFVAQYEKPLKILAHAGIDASSVITATGRQAARLADLRASLDDAKSLLKFDTTDDLVSAALSDPRTMQKLTATLDARGRNNLARHIMTEAFQDGKSAQGMLEFLTENRRTIQMAMSAANGPTVARQHYNNLLDIQKGLSMLETVGGVRGVTRGGTDPLRNATGVSMPTVWAQWRAVAAGRQGVGTAISMIAGPAITRLNQIQFDDVMNKALNDPSTARQLIDFLRSPPAQANAVGQRLLNAMKAVKDVAPIVANAAIGADRFKGNLGQSAMPIASSLQNDALIEEQP